MSITTQPKDYQDLVRDLLNRVRESTGVTETTNIAKRYIQTAHADIYLGNGEKFPWAERRSKITTHAVYNTGTITATMGSPSLTGSGTLWNTNNNLGMKNMRQGGKLVINGTAQVYEVVSVTTDTAAVMTPAWNDATASGLTYSYFEDEYALNISFAKPVDLHSFDDFHTIRLIGRQDFRRLYPNNRTPGTRFNAATIIDLPPSGSTEPVRKVVLAPPPSDAQIVPYTYVTKYIVVNSIGTAQEEFSADSDEPIMPRRFRHSIVYHAMSHWYRDRKDDPRSAEAAAEFRDLLERMISDSDVGAQRMRVVANANAYKVRARNPYRGSTKRYDTSNRFDRFED